MYMCMCYAMLCFCLSIVSLHLWFQFVFSLFFPSNFGSSTSSVAEAHTRNGCAWLWSTRWYFGNVLQRWYNHNKALKMQTDIVLMPIGWWKILNVLPLRSNRIAILVRSHMCVSSQFTRHIGLYIFEYMAEEARLLYSVWWIVECVDVCVSECMLMAAMMRQINILSEIRNHFASLSQCQRCRFYKSAHIISESRWKCYRKIFATSFVFIAYLSSMSIEMCVRSCWCWWWWARVSVSVWEWERVHEFEYVCLISYIQYCLPTSLFHSSLLVPLACNRLRSFRAAVHTCLFWMRSSNYMAEFRCLEFQHRWEKIDIDTKGSKKKEKKREVNGTICLNTLCVCVNIFLHIHSRTHTQAHTHTRSTTNSAHTHTHNNTLLTHSFTHSFSLRSWIGGTESYYWDGYIIILSSKGSQVEWKLKRKFEFHAMAEGNKRSLFRWYCHCIAAERRMVPLTISPISSLCRKCVYSICLALQIDI